VEFPEYIIYSEGVETVLDEIETILQWRKQERKEDMQMFLGLNNICDDFLMICKQDEAYYRPS